MAYQGPRGVVWLDRMTKTVTQTPEGADRLSRWLFMGYIALTLSFTYLGLAMAVYGSDNGSFVAMIGTMFGLVLPLTLLRRIHFATDGDERERLLAWRAFSLSGMIVGVVLAIWMVANGAFDTQRLWVPETKYQWRAFAFATLASLQGFASFAIVWMQPPYLAEPDEEKMI